MVVTVTASLDYFALCGGLCFFSGSSLWWGKEGMFGQIRLFWKLSCVLKNMSNLYLLKGV